MFLSAEIPTQRYNNMAHNWGHSGRGYSMSWRGGNFVGGTAV